MFYKFSISCSAKCPISLWGSAHILSDKYRILAYGLWGFSNINYQYTLEPFLLIVRNDKFLLYRNPVTTEHLYSKYLSIFFKYCHNYTLFRTEFPAYSQIYILLFFASLSFLRGQKDKFFSFIVEHRIGETVHCHFGGLDQSQLSRDALNPTNAAL